MITKNKRWSAGRIILSFMGLFTMVSPYLADWNITHIYNPTWPPHAKFHNAQTMVLGAFLGLLTLYSLWFRKGIDETQKLKEAALFVVDACASWDSRIDTYAFNRLSQAGCILTNVNSLMAELQNNLAVSDPDAAKANINNVLGFYQKFVGPVSLMMGGFKGNISR